MVWVFLILMFSPIGAIAWFAAGRPPRAVRMSNGEMWRLVAGFPEAGRPRRGQPVAPDDHPEFLRDVAWSRNDDQAMMQP